MGYSEIHCELCGVSFNIGRIRQVNESLDNGWAFRERRTLGYDGHQTDERYNFVSMEYVQRDRCPPEAGCCSVLREVAVRNSELHKRLAHSLTSYIQLESKILQGTLSIDPAKLVNPLGPEIRLTAWNDLVEEENDDTEYAYESDADDEPLEYMSDEEPGYTPLDKDGDLERSDTVCSYLSAAVRSPAFNHQIVEAEAENENDFEIRESGPNPIRLEHLAGPGCINRYGYSSHRIGVEEMRGCNLMQCLLRKQPDWSPEGDDQGFELSSSYYLSGLSGCVPSRDDNHPKYTIERHNHGDDFYPDNVFMLWNDEFSTPMPFHPTCFEIFMRVSRLRMEHVDVKGLAAWRRREANISRDHLRHPAVKRAKSQEWKHVPGDEFLAANPVLVPALPAILCDSFEEDPNFNVQDNAFEQDGLVFSRRRSDNTDPFLTLSNDIITLLLGFFGSREVANLRLSSRAFRNLPISLFRRLLVEEMPWLWEAWDDAPPSMWTVHTAASIQECNIWPQRVAKQLKDEQDLYKKIIHEEMPEILESYVQDYPWLQLDPVRLAEETKQEMLQQHWEQMPIAKLDVKRTNWYRLYCGITSHWKELKGLQNRQRIWVDVEEIVGRIQRYRENGEVSG